MPTNVPPACIALASSGAVPTSTATAAASSFFTVSPASSFSDSFSSSGSIVTGAANATVTSTDTASSAVSVLSTGAGNVTSSALPTDISGNATATVLTTSVSGSVTATAPVNGSTTSSAAPTSAAASATLTRRIAQDDLPAVAQSWQDLCLVSGGDIFTNEPCVQLAGVNGINALLADADPCAQQDNADAMIDFAKSPGVTNADALIANAIAYRRHPRNAFSIGGVVPSTPFCQRAPRNAELANVTNAQLDGVNAGIFGNINLGLLAFGADGTCPFGQSPDVSTCSCS
ncbi:hypothetical protein C8Q78DRAFT_970218 [Trametes maxima]|nr:hypothetical protein C8Q78DRAFT_970218 [Trametes maxima]